MITIELGSTKDMQENSEELLKEHYEELALNKDFVKLEPDWDRYYRLEELGMITVFLAKDEEKVVGYSVFFTHPHGHIHYKSLKMASNDVLFLTKEYRTRSSAGLKLLRYADEYFRQHLGEGCKICYHIKASNDFSPILKRFGYNHEEVIMGKVLV